MSWTDKDLQDLRDLRDALEAMEVKELGWVLYIDEYGECCGNGATALWRGLTPEDIRSFKNPDDAIKKIRMSYKVHDSINMVNDVLGSEDTPKERWHRMRRWVDEQLGDAA